MEPDKTDTAFYAYTSLPTKTTFEYNDFQKDLLERATWDGFRHTLRGLTVVSAQASNVIRDFTAAWTGVPVKVWGFLDEFSEFEDWSYWDRHYKTANGYIYLRLKEYTSHETYTPSVTRRLPFLPAYFGGSVYSRYEHSGRIRTNKSGHARALIARALDAYDVTRIRIRGLDGCDYTAPPVTIALSSALQQRRLQLDSQRWANRGSDHRSFPSSSRSKGRRR